MLAFVAMLDSLVPVIVTQPYSSIWKVIIPSIPSFQWQSNETDPFGFQASSEEFPGAIYLFSSCLTFGAVVCAVFLHFHLRGRRLYDKEDDKQESNERKDVTEEHSNQEKADDSVENHI